MKSTVAKQAKSTIKITVEVEPEKVAELLPEAAKRLSAKLKIPGFRPGNAPLAIVQQRVGEGALWEEAAQLGLPHFYSSVVLNEKLEVIGQPRVTITSLAPHNTFTFTVEVAVLPEFTLPEYKGLEVEKEAVVVTDEDVQKAIDDVRRLRAEQKSVDRPSQKGDRVEVNFTITKDGAMIDGGHSKNHPIVLGEGHFVPGFEDNLIGLKLNEPKTFSLTYPKDYKLGGLAGQTAQVEAELKLIQEVILPELNDNFAKKLGKFDSVEDLKKKIREGLTSEAEQKAKEKFEVALIDAVLAKVEIELPDVLIEAEKDKMFEEFSREIVSRGMEVDKYLGSARTTVSEVRESFTEQAQKRVRAGLVLRAVAQKEEIKPSEEELDAAIADTLKMYQNNEAARKQLSSPQYREYVASRLTNDKTLAFLVEHAKVREAKKTKES